MKQKVLLIFFMLHSFTLPLSAAESGYVEQFGKKFMVRPFVSYNVLALEISDSSADSGSSITYYPNPGVKAGISLFYKTFGTSFAYSSSSSSENRRGTTEIIDYQLHSYTGRYGFDLSYQRYRGYYLENPEDWGLSAGDEGTVRDDLTIQSAGANFYRVFSPEFSMPAAFDQTERQIKTAWSFLLMGSAGYFIVRGDSALIPAGYASGYGAYADFSGGRFLSIGLSPGIGITVPHKRYFASAALFVGSGLMIRKYSGGGGSRGSFGKVNFRCSAGYSGDEFSAGISAYLDITDTDDFFSDNSEPALQVFNLTVTLAAGYRFGL